MSLSEIRFRKSPLKYTRLIKIKKELGHGKWLPYLKNELNYSERTAQRLIRVATEFSNTTSMSDLQSTKIIALLDIPQEYRDDFISNHSVEDSTVRELKKEIQKYKEENGLLTEKLKKLLATNFGRTKNDPAKQVKVASEYVELVGNSHGGNRKSNYESRNLKLEDIAKALGTSKTTLTELLEIDRKLIPQIRELFDNGKITKYTANKVWCRLSPEDQERFFNEIGRDKISQMTQAQTQKYIDDLKQGRRYLELERIYGIKKGGDRKSKGDNLLLKKDVCNSVGITEKQMTEYLRLLK